VIPTAVVSLPRPCRASDASTGRSAVALVLAALMSVGPQASTAGDDAARPRSPALDPSIPTLEVLQARGAVIGEIRVVVEEIFDRADRRENHGLYRLANRLHVATRESVVRTQLLFREGEKLDANRLEESERILRGRRYLFDCWVRPVSYDGNKVDIEVRIRDVWTLNPGIDLGRTGGKNTSGFDVEEENLFGRGKFIEIGRKNDVDRTRTLVEYDDSNVLGSWWQFASSYSDNSDGKDKVLFVSRPFYSLATRWSVTLSAFDSQRLDSRYDLGNIVDQFKVDERRFELSGGWSSGVVNGWTRRWSGGVRYSRSRFAFAADAPAPAVLPGDREFAYPFAAFDLIEDQFDKTRNQDQIARTEDLYYGIRVHAEAGYMTPGFGADRTAEVFAASLLTGHHLAPLQSLFTSTALSGRLESGDARDVLLQTSAHYYWHFTPHQLFYVALDAAATHQLDLDQQVLLGGDEGLRGYPLRYQGGTARALLTLEERYFTDWFPFRLVNVGAAAFFDAGRTWGRGPVSTPSLGLLKDFGVGLRFGNSRSGLGNVVHIDFSYALDGDSSFRKFQVTLQTKESF
jgi:hypothetical protein